MKSPFPGMDPYLESRWRDVHQKLVTYIADALQPGLPEALVARTEERVIVDSPGRVDGLSDYYPDVRVIDDGWDGAPESLRVGPPDDAVVATEPIVMILSPEPMTEGFVQILDASGGQVVTVIEVISPTNKQPGKGASSYVSKRRELEAAGVGVVEIDLLRRGNRVQRVPEPRLPARFRTAYRACVKPGYWEDRASYYPMPLRASLPTIRVPLREGDPDSPLDLQAVFEQVYRNGRYDRTDYTVDANPPLVGNDAAWADEMLRAAGRR